MKKWFVLTVVGADRPGIVAHLTAALYDGGCNLGEASMLRLGGNFTIMVMVQHQGTAHQLQQLVQPVAESLGLRVHVDVSQGGPHQHLEPDVIIRIAGADRTGIVARVTQLLASAGLNILNLESDVAGTVQQPLYIMHIEGQAVAGVAALESALQIIRRDGVDATLQRIDTVIG
ncbi:MAG: ACT domain-containing protein [Gammaproteobacteria bacterium]|nr:ACT domain-containing protein [Gammaproteobacteria bacterium]